MAVKTKSIKLNFVMNAILTMSTFIFPLITFPYVSRVLGPDGTGKVSFATSLMTYFSMLAQLGIPTYGIRVCAKVRDDKEALTRTAHELLMINLIMNVISYGILILGLAFVPRLQGERTLYILVSATILLTSIGMEWLYKAMEQYTYITIRSIVFKLLAMVLMFLLVKEEKDYVVYGFLTIVAASASNIFNLINVHKYIDLRPVGGYNIRQHFKPVAIFFAMACATTIYTHLDTVMLGFMVSDDDVGLYQAATRIKTILVSVITSLGTVLLPRVSYYIQKGRMDEFDRISKKAIHFIFVVSIPVALYFTIFAREGVLLLAGSQYEGSILPMQIIMPTLFFIGLTNIMGIQILVPLGKEKIVLYSVVTGAVVDVILNALLIPIWYSEGAAVGTLVAEIVVFIFQIASFKGKLNSAYKSVPYVKLFIAIILAVISCIWTKFIDMGVFIRLIISSPLFFAVYFGILLLMKEELTVEIIGQIITKLFRRRKG